MGYLRGFKETVEKAYKQSAFDLAKNSGQRWRFYMADGGCEVGKVIENKKYEFILEPEANTTKEIKKLSVELMFPDALTGKLETFIRTDESLIEDKHEVSVAIKERHHIKNKTLYPLVMDKERVSITTYSGKIIEGVITTFTHFELLLTLGEKLPVIILRHCVLKADSLKGVNLLKEYQRVEKPWRKSRFWVEGHPNQSEKKPKKGSDKKRFAKKGRRPFKKRDDSQTPPTSKG